MLTFTQRKKMAAKRCGIHYEDNEMEYIVQNINNADKAFQNASRRPWTRKEKRANITADKQYYQIASDMYRVSDVRCRQSSNSNVVMPLTEVRSEHEWNKMNSYPHSGMFPTHFFIRGNDEIGIYPTPAENITDGLIVAYEPRIRDMGVEDIEFDASVTRNGTAITVTSVDDSEGLQDVFADYMTENWYAYRTDGKDGNYYKIQKVIDPQHAVLENNYLGNTATNAPFLIGQVPPYPEEFHDAAVYYACFQFFSMRKDTDSAAMYRTLWETALDEYKARYGNKTVSGVITPGYKRMPTIGDVFANSTITEGV